MKKKRQNAEKGRALAEAEAKPVDLLKQDHEKVKALFEEFEEVETPAEKERIVKTCIQELKVHTQLEEEVFYPAAREALSEKDEEEGEDLMNEAEEEHHVVDLIIEELQQMSPHDEMYDAKFMVMAENVKHHIKEEESEMFPKIKNTEANSEETGSEMVQRKAELMQGVEQEITEPMKRRSSKKTKKAA